MIEQLILMMSDLMPEEEIIDDIISSAQQRKISGDDESLHKLLFSCTLMLSKSKVNKMGVEQTMKDFESFKKKKKVFDIDDNGN